MAAFQQVFIFLPMILFLGIITSYSDIKHHKIHNRWIILSLCYSLLAYTAYGIYSGFSSGYLQLLAATALNLLCALAFGILFWLSRYWSAADAKLFISFSLLVPVPVYFAGYFGYSASYFSFFPSLTLILISFVLMATIFMAQAVISSPGRLLPATKNLFNAKLLLRMLLQAFLMQWLFGWVFPLIGIRSSMLTILVFMLVFSLLSGIQPGSFMHQWKGHGDKILLLLSVFRLLFDKSIYSLPYLEQFLILAIVYAFIRLFVMKLSDDAFSDDVSVARLMPGMIPTQKAVWQNGKFRLFSNDFIAGNDDKKGKAGTLLFKDMFLGRLTFADIRQLKAAQGKNQLAFSSLKIARQSFFAPYLFAAVLAVVAAYALHIYF
jgi:hypothetical protein